MYKLKNIDSWVCVNPYGLELCRGNTINTGIIVYTGCITVLWACGSVPICRDGPISKWQLQSLY